MIRSDCREIAVYKIILNINPDRIIKAATVIQVFVAKGIPVGTAIAFMMAVVGLSLPEATLLKKVMSWRLIGISGEVIRKLNVTPRGIPPLTKPMNNGMDEHEQNGVIAPNKAANNRFRLERYLSDWVKSIQQNSETESESWENTGTPFMKL